MDLDPLLGGRGLGVHRGANICGLADTQADHRWPAPAVIITIAAVSEPLDVLSEALAGTDGFTELRYHDKSTRTVSVEKAKVEATGYRRRGRLSALVRALPAFAEYVGRLRGVSGPVVAGPLPGKILGRGIGQGTTL